MLKKRTPKVLVSRNEVLATTSINIAEVFGKLHKNILQSIELLKPNLPQKFWELNFQLSNYETKTGRNTVTQNPMYLLTRDAFTLLVMGFTGKKALQFKLAYIAEFNRMQALLNEKKEQNIPLSSKEPQLALMDGQYFATSLNIAEVFGKHHQHVLRDIRIIEKKVDFDFFDEHFQMSSYSSSNGLDCPLYYLSRTGLSLLLMTYPNAKNFLFKRLFLEKFLEMEQKTEVKQLPDKQNYLYVETLLEHLQKYKQSLLPRERPSRDYLDFIEGSLKNILTS